MIIFVAFLVLVGAYDPEESMEMYRYASAVFCTDEVLIEWSCEYPCRNTTGMINQKIIHDGLTNVRAFVGYQSRNSKIVVAIRGSNGIVNFFHNALIYLKSFPQCTKCKVHYGFLLNWYSISSEVKQHIEHLRTLYPEAPIFLTGHSMGGAVATLAALELHKMFKVQAVYSYGSPRVGNLEFAVEVSDAVKVHRVVLAKDIYPFLPPIWMGYYHVSTEIFYSSFNNYTVCEYGEDWNQVCQNSVPWGDVRRRYHTMYFGVRNTCDGVDVEKEDL